MEPAARDACLHSGHAVRTQRRTPAARGSSGCTTPRGKALVAARTTVAPSVPTTAPRACRCRLSPRGCACRRRRRRRRPPASLRRSASQRAVLAAPSSSTAPPRRVRPPLRVTSPRGRTRGRWWRVAPTFPALVFAAASSSTGRRARPSHAAMANPETAASTLPGGAARVDGRDEASRRRHRFAASRPPPAPSPPLCSRCAAARRIVPRRGGQRPPRARQRLVRGAARTSRRCEVLNDSASVARCGGCASSATGELRTTARSSCRERDGLPRPRRLRRPAPPTAASTTAGS